MFHLDINVLVVGCGGLGCELVKSLVLNGFGRISVVDHDRIAISNLNRQFLFQEADVNKYKAQAVCEFLNGYWNTAPSDSTTTAALDLAKSSPGVPKSGCTFVSENPDEGTVVDSGVEVVKAPKLTTDGPTTVATAYSTYVRSSNFGGSPSYTPDGPLTVSIPNRGCNMSITGSTNDGSNTPSATSGNLDHSQSFAEQSLSATTKRVFQCSSASADLGPVSGRVVSAKCYCCKIQHLDLEILGQFDVVFAALDSVTARRWLNWAVHEVVNRNLVKNNRVNWGPDSPFDMGLSTRRPSVLLIDGGSQGLYGHVRVVEPYTTACIECSLGLFSSETPFPCVLTNLRTPEDCVHHAIDLELDSKTDQLDLSSTNLDQRLLNIYTLSKRFADANGIEGVTLDLVDQICNRSTPNVATTNSIIASLMVNFVLSNSSHPSKDTSVDNPTRITSCRNNSLRENFYFYTGDGSTGLTKFTLEPDLGCAICGSKCIDVQVYPHSTLSDLLSILSERLGSEPFNVISDETTIYLGSPVTLRDSYSHRLETRLRYEPTHCFQFILFCSDFSIGNGRLYVTNSTSPTTWVVHLNFLTHN